MPLTNNFIGRDSALALSAPRSSGATDGVICGIGQSVPPASARAVTPQRGVLPVRLFAKDIISDE
jgi:hypothetical protein